jgi:ubiquinone/menaquinone biosynthesis C-methylase UbiE
MEPDPLDTRAVRAAYDTVAESYAALLRTAHDEQPYDRAVLALFAELVRTAGGGPVADVGCGPGRITAPLHALGVDVVGVDLSPGMLAVAHRTHPDLRFVEGTLTGLAIGDGRLGGVVAWYSIIHLPPEQRPSAFAELHRVLAPGGRLLLAFQVGDERVHIEHAYGHDVSAYAYRLPPDHVADLATAAGFTVEARLVRVAMGVEKIPQAYLLARKEP